MCDESSEFRSEEGVDDDHDVDQVIEQRLSKTYAGGLVVTVSERAHVVAAKKRFCEVCITVFDPKTKRRETKCYRIPCDKAVKVIGVAEEKK